MAQLETGHILPFAFERKSIGDLYGTLGKGHTRFKKEVQRAIDSDIKMYFIIEGSFTKISKGYKYSKLKPYILLKILGTLWNRYENNFQPIFCSNRKEMENFILWRFFSGAKEHARNNTKKGGAI